MKPTTQKQAVFQHLKTGKTLTQEEAYTEIGTQRLGAIIFNLRKEGSHIESIPIKSTNRFGHNVNLCKYYLVDNDYVNAGVTSQKQFNNIVNNLK